MGDLSSPAGFRFIKSRTPEDEEQLDDALDQVELLCVYLFVGYAMLVQFHKHRQIDMYRQDTFR